GARTFQLGQLDAIVLPEPMVTITLKNYDQAVLSLDLQEEWGKLHGGDERIDRKSTRLNSSHVKISYAVFCLKKKKISGIARLVNDSNYSFSLRGSFWFDKCL